MSDEYLNCELNESLLVEFIKLVHKYTGITISASRKTMLQGRIRPRLRDLNLLNYKEYKIYLESHPEEVPMFIDLITTNETYFYRTPRIWKFIEMEFIPNWISVNQGSTFNAWSAAASSGEEACTLGVILQHIKSKYPSFKYQIDGTDISGEILSYAEKGEFSERSVSFLKKEREDLFSKYIRQSEAGIYSVLSEIRKNVKFQKHNLFDISKSTNKYDLVLMRNVLIYFNANDQEKVLSNIKHTMKQDAFLIIGESESLNRLDTPFEFKTPLIYTLKSKQKEKVA